MQYQIQMSEDYRRQATVIDTLHGKMIVIFAKNFVTTILNDSIDYKFSLRTEEVTTYHGITDHSHAFHVLFFHHCVSDHQKHTIGQKLDIRIDI